ncbi:FtsX-like permease family protein [Streptomyces sp. DT24]|uniref:FtsX-like permease family protein n=1 Tax=Streptomyces sp. DT24 TaxID=3416520 RepID=UPI003CF63543
MTTRSGPAPRALSACAPWVRTRLRTAPGAASALAALVLLTAFLAAGFPRAVDAYETDGLRDAVTSTTPRRSVLELSTPPPGLEHPRAVREDALRATQLAGTYRESLRKLPEPVRADAHESSYGVRTAQPIAAADPGLPRPYGLDPQFTYATPSALTGHSTLRAGRWPAVRGEVTAATAEVEAAVTEETAAALKLRPGSAVTVPKQNGASLTVRVTAVVAPLRPENSYWSAEQLLRTPSLVAKPTKETPRYYWTAAFLLPQDAGPVLLATTGEPELYWRFAPDATRLTGLDVPRLRSAIASLEGGPELLGLRDVAGPTATLTTDLDGVLAGYGATRSAIGPVVTVAAVGTGAVAAVVLLMTGGLIGARRHTELALLRSRGGSLRGIGRRLFAETAVTVVPAAALGLLLAVTVVGGARLWPAVIGAAGVAALVCVALPLRTTLSHITPMLHRDRNDVMNARPSRRRTVGELTLLVLAVGAVVALRRRGTGDGGTGSGAAGGTDWLVSSAPVLAGLIAALVLVRLYPLPLRLASRAASRTRGAVGFLSLARAGRSSANGTLPLLALLIALTTAAFGGSVIAGVAQARDDAAVLATGADARIGGLGDTAPLPDRLLRSVRDATGVRDVAPVQIEYGVPLPPNPNGFEDAKGTTLIGVDPTTYARLAGRTGLGEFRPDRLKATGPATPEGAVPSEDRVLTAIASPSVAARLGDRPRDIQSLAGDFKVRVVGTASRTPAVDDTDFLVVDAASLTQRHTTTLLVTGDPLNAGELRALAHREGKDFTVQLRSETREAFVDTPLQSGAERIYGFAVAAGAGYALLAVGLSLLRTAPERTTLLARLRTMGLTTRQGRRLLGLEAMPQALLAAVGGLLVGWATIALLAPGIDLAGLALAGAPGSGALTAARLRADPWSLTLPALGVVVLTALAAGAQAWWASRRGTITELRAGDPR